MSALDIIHDNARQARERGSEKLNVYRQGTPEHIAYELGWEGYVTLHTRDDGQVYAIESLGGGEFTAVVPEDLAGHGEGATWETLAGAYEYLTNLIANPARD